MQKITSFTDSRTPEVRSPTLKGTSTGPTPAPAVLGRRKAAGPPPGSKWSEPKATSCLWTLLDPAEKCGWESTGWQRMRDGALRPTWRWVGATTKPWTSGPRVGCSVPAGGPLTPRLPHSEAPGVHSVPNPTQPRHRVACLPSSQCVNCGRPAFRTSSEKQQALLFFPLFPEKSGRLSLSMSAFLKQAPR